jgi:uncharacterized protein
MTTRRKFIATFIGTSVAAAAYPCYIEPRWLEVTRRHVPVTPSGEGAPVRILHLSDLHASLEVPLSMIADAVTAGLAEKPDVVCLTGDFITRRDDFDPAGYARVLGRLSAQAPCFAVLGNHDGGPWSATRLGYPDHHRIEHILEDAGVELLHNRSRQIQVAGRTLQFVGVGDYWTGELRSARAFSGAHRMLPTILLAHNPDSKDEVGDQSWSLMLSGHTHGGQVRIFEGDRYAPVHDKRYVAGLKPWGGRFIHVTRGVGSLAGVRFRCRPEASLLTLG